MPRTVIGCDLSRAHLDLQALPDGRSRRVENIADTIAPRADGLDYATLVVLEATSECDGPLMAALGARGIPFARVDPRQADHAHHPGPRPPR